MARIHTELLRRCLGNEWERLGTKLLHHFVNKLFTDKCCLLLSCSCKAGKYCLLRNICCSLSELTCLLGIVFWTVSFERRLTFSCTDT